MMTHLQYIGVSGMGSKEQQQEAGMVFSDVRLSELGRKLLIGVKATTRTQVDERPSGYKDDWYPVGGALRNLLYRRTDSVNVLQLYADDWTNLHDRALPLMDKSLARADEWLDGLQFDILPWFDEGSSLQIIKKYAPMVEGPVILQCFGDIMHRQSPDTVMERLKRVEGYVSHVLFDASEGRGELMDADSLSDWVEALQSSDVEMEPVIAGGLSADSVRTLLPPIIRRFGNISWDAESSLHTENILDDNKVKDCLSASSEVLSNQ